MQSTMSARRAFALFCFPRSAREREALKKKWKNLVQNEQSIE